MELPSTELLTLLYKLVPGFIAAAAFHALTPYPKRDALERIVTAVVFSVIANLLVEMLGALLLWIGHHVGAVGSWSTRTELFWGLVIGLALGVAWAHAVNRGFTHRLPRRWGTTKKTSLPTQWYAAFSEVEQFVILHFDDERRLMGWPRQWPDDPETGHFILESPGWVLKTGEKIPMLSVDKFLISARGVTAVEFLRFGDDPVLVDQAAEIESTQTQLAKLHKEDEDEQRRIGRQDVRSPPPDERAEQSE